MSTDPGFRFVRGKLDFNPLKNQSNDSNAQDKLDLKLVTRIVEKPPDW